MRAEVRREPWWMGLEPAGAGIPDSSGLLRKSASQSDLPNNANPTGNSSNDSLSKSDTRLCLRNAAVNGALALAPPDASAAGEEMLGIAHQWIRMQTVAV